MTRQMLGDAEWAALKDKLQTIGRIWKHGDEGRNCSRPQSSAGLLAIIAFFCPNWVRLAAAPNPQ